MCACTPSTSSHPEALSGTVAVLLLFQLWCCHDLVCACVCACARGQILKWEKAQSNRSRRKLFEHMREQKWQIKPDWGQCESEAARGPQPTSSLASRPGDPPAAPFHPFFHSRYPASLCTPNPSPEPSPLFLRRHAGFFCTLDPSPAIWLKLYINNTELHARHPQVAFP